MAQRTLYGRRAIDMIEAQQALLFVLMGISIVLSNGEALRVSVFMMLNSFTSMCIGYGELIFGSIYFYGIYSKHTLLCFLCDWIAALIWCFFIGFYIIQAVHKVGAVICLVQSLSCGGCCYSRLDRLQDGRHGR